jgi:hypothetical protein
MVLYQFEKRRLLIFFDFSTTNSFTKKEKENVCIYCSYLQDTACPLYPIAMVLPSYSATYVHPSGPKNRLALAFVSYLGRRLY